MHPPLGNEDSHSSERTPGILTGVPYDAGNREPLDFPVRNSSIDLNSIDKRTQTRTENQTGLRGELGERPGDRSPSDEFVSVRFHHSLAMLAERAPVGQS